MSFSSLWNICVSPTFLLSKSFANEHQTCRSLNILGSVRLVWLRFYQIFRPFEAEIAKSYPTAALQRMAVDALKVDLNWARDTPRLRSVQVLPQLRSEGERLVRNMRLLHNGLSLITFYEDVVANAKGTTVRLWDISLLTRPVLVAHFRIPAEKLVIEVVEDDNVIMVVGSSGLPALSQKIFYIYEIDAAHVKTLEPLLFGEESWGAVYSMALSGDILSGLLIGMPLFRLFFINRKTRESSYVMLDRHDMGPKIQNLALDGSILLFSATASYTLLQLYSVPPLFPRPKEVVSQPRSEMRLEREGIWPTLYVGNPNHLRSSPTFSSSIPLMWLPSMSAFPRDMAHRYTISASDITGLEVKKHRTYSLQLDKSCLSVTIGASGQKGVWIEKNMASEELEMRLMRLNDTDGRSNTSPLCPGPLPFPVHDVEHLVFDENSTRLVASLITGDVYVLEFS
ncbi:hypothetical protein SISNIDRAFT_457694 [Sistotremastrum niveocremeum HHB9708]|uniref:F-box domain-containing protein n=1 Tax=Sistotremastrum niveocremeum HHB9708 TaxID=1314777 RepID=A0A164RGA5_9AGAM|nr:hypothetical protein SISNIDRAFT_457694 [Sistotremastrum niveocremeum HHB9708]